MNKKQNALNPERKIIGENQKKECFESTITSFPEGIKDISFDNHREE